jgi:hypothetical protein
MKRIILNTFMHSYDWDVYLERRFHRSSVRWVNAIAWARANLADLKVNILMKEKYVPSGGYLLVADAAKIERRRLLQQKVPADLAATEGSFDADKKKRKRAGQRQRRGVYCC